MLKLMNTENGKKMKRKQRRHTRPISSQREALKEAAVVMTWGKLVAPGKLPPNLVPGPTLETPWRASDHHSYPLIPSLGTSMALFTSSLIFSCNVNLPTRSLALSWIGRDTLQKGKFLVTPFRGSHAKGSRASANEQRRAARRRRTENWV